MVRSRAPGPLTPREARQQGYRRGPGGGPRGVARGLEHRDLEVQYQTAERAHRCPGLVRGR